MAIWWLSRWENQNGTVDGTGDSPCSECKHIQVKGDFGNSHKSNMVSDTCGLLGLCLCCLLS